MCTFCSDLGAAFATPYTKNRRGHKIKFLLKLCGSKMRIDRETITRLRIKPREYIGSFEIAFCLGCGHEHNCGMYGCAVIREAIDRISIAEWIPDTLELPPDDREIFVLTRSKNGSRNVDKGYWSIDQQRFVHRGTAEVTHWMPIPESPKED